MNHINTPCIEAYTVAESFAPYIAKQSDVDNEYYIKRENNYFFKKLISSEEIIRLAKNILAEKLNTQSAVNHPDDIRNYLNIQFSRHEREVFGALFLNSRRQPISFEILFYGSISASEVHPREIIKRVLSHNADSVIFAHNHPSSNVTPSDADIRVTRKIAGALSFIDVKVLDHLIFSHGSSCSLAELGEI